MGFASELGKVLVSEAAAGLDPVGVLNSLRGSREGIGAGLVGLVPELNGPAPDPRESDNHNTAHTPKTATSAQNNLML